MDAERIVKLSPQAVRELVDAAAVPSHAKQDLSKRRTERWPFAGTVEIWLPDECYGERHLLATVHNISLHGFAVRTRRPIPNGTQVSFALHQPELSGYGTGQVRHCTRAQVGYLIGVEFVFEDAKEA
ncbi:PilZ domain protein [Phycisphaerae bacterium RAS1]|nr:PilZ domain protein [Phycisphaerae bacterium RAS1]